MTPERLEEIRERARIHAGYYPSKSRGTGAARDREDLLDYIDTLLLDNAALRRGQGTYQGKEAP